MCRQGHETLHHQGGVAPERAAQAGPLSTVCSRHELGWSGLGWAAGSKAQGLAGSWVTVLLEMSTSHYMQVHNSLNDTTRTSGTDSRHEDAHAEGSGDDPYAGRQ